MLLAVLFLITGTSQAIEDDSKKSETAWRCENSSTTDIQHQKNELCPKEWEGNLPHTSSCSQYYKCKNGFAITCQCKSGLLFDKISATCINSDAVRCENSTLTTNICTNQLDGLFPNYSNQCQQYYKCKGGNIVSMNSCPISQAFSFNHQACLSQEQVSCVRPVCNPEDNDFFWLPGTFCRAYYYCQYGQPLYFTCAEGLVFNREAKDCVKGGECYEPICAGLTDGSHPDTTHGCRRSLQCKAGSLESVTSCSLDNIPYGKTCSQSAVTHCPNPDATAVSVETIRDDCSGYSNGLHVIQGTSCRRYQFCEDGRALARMACPIGLRFNGRSCAPESETICDDPCASKPDGYHADDNEGCRKYHFCRSGETTERLSCPEGTLFSGHMCLPSALVSCDIKSAPPVNPCIGLSDGFHADYLNGCNAYYYCASYSSVLQSSCPEGMIWNGIECVIKTPALCQDSVSHAECHGLRTGLYQDQQSNCSKYFYCYNGNRTLLSCPKGRIFDGETCVKADDYLCPSQEPDTCFNKTDGYRINQDSGCRSYYYCTNGKKVTYVCPGSQIFNGTTCVFPNKFHCPFTSKACTSKPDGYYPDRSTYCRKYFYCRKGYKLTTFDCNAKKFFNGEHCVTASKSEYRCHRSQ